MNNEYGLCGMRIIMRRLFKQDFNQITECYREYDKLFHNPVDSLFAENVFYSGEIWGAFWNDRLISCCYYFPLNSKFYSDTKSYDALCDFTEHPEKYFYIGYIGINRGIIEAVKSKNNYAKAPKECDLYSAFLNIGQMQAFRRGHKYILHSLPVKMNFDVEPLFAAGYSLIKLRGLEKLVVHYIFAKPVFPEENIYETMGATENISKNDTKKVSALLENGYCVVDIDKNSDEFLIRRLVGNE